MSVRGGYGRGGIGHDSRGRRHLRNKHWSAGDSRSYTPNNAGGERWERGGHRGGGRGRGYFRGSVPTFQNVSLHLNRQHTQNATESGAQLEDVHGNENEYKNDIVDEDYDMDSEDGDGSGYLIEEPELETQEDRDKFFQEVSIY